jgi:translocation and assembly module TamB
MPALTLIRRLAIWTGVVLLGLALLAAGLRLAAGQAPGRWLITSQLDGRDIPGAGRISITGVSGDPLSRLRIERLTLSDDEGVWLIAEDIMLGWRARSVITQPVRIDALTIERLAIARRPILTGATETSANPGSNGRASLPPVDLTQFTLARLELAEGVAGPQAALSINASGRLRPGTSRLALNAERLDAPGDRLEAALTIDADGVSGTLSATGEADGTLAALLSMEGHAVRIDGTLSGTPESGGGQLALSGDDEAWADAEIRWDPASWLVNADIRAARWGLVPEPLAAEVAEVQARAEGSRAGGFAIDRLILETGESRLSLRDVMAPLIEAEFDISPALLERLSDQRVAARSLTGTATIARVGGINIQLRPDIAGLVLPGLEIGQVEGAIGITLPGGHPRLALDLGLQALRTGQAEIDRLAGDRLQVSGIVSNPDSATGWQIGPGFTLTSDAASATIDARLPSGSEWPVGEMSAEISDTALLRAEIGGPARATVTLAADRSIAVSLDGRDMLWPDSTRSLLDGLVADARLSPSDEGWEISAFNARSPSLDLTLTGRFNDAADWQAGGDLALVGALPVAAIEIDGGLATAFRLVRDADGLSLRSVTTSRQLQAGPVMLGAPRLAVEGLLLGPAEDEPPTLDWAFTADREAGAIALDGQLSLATDATTLTLARGQVGAVRLTGSARLADQSLTVTVNANRTDYISLVANFDGQLDDLMTGVLDASLALDPQRLGAADLNAATLTLVGPLSEIAVNARADGQMRSNFDISATGEVNLRDDGVAVSLSPSGKWATHNWATQEPIRVATGADGLTASAIFTLGGGRVELDLQTAGLSPIASLTVDSLPVGVLADIAAMPSTAGVISGAADLREREGIWRGSAQLEASGLLAADLPDMPELTLSANASIEDEAHVVLRLTGGGLVARGEVTRAGPTTDIAHLQGDADTPLSGLIEANGALMALAALFLPSDILLETGEIESRLAISGTVGEPHLDGAVALRDGRINATTAGSLVTGLDVDLTLSETSIELTRLAASDGREGTLSGTGRIDLGADGRPAGGGRLEYERFVAVRRPALTFQATGAVDLTLDDDGLLVGGESRVDQLRIQPTLNGAASIPQLQVVEINLPEDRRSNGEPRIPVRIDYRVRAANGLFVSSRAFTSEWGVDLHVTGPESKPSVFGTATLVGGSAFVFNRRFTLASGTVTFDGSPDDARVDLTAVHSRSGFRASARVEGSVQAPTITLSSDPALPEDEILARLLFDQSVSQLGAFEAAQLAAQLSGQGLLDVVGQLRDLTGIDRLDISTTEDGGLAVVGGRRFGDNVYVEVGSNGAAAINEALIEWSLSPDLSVLSRVSADTDATVAIRWRRDY